MTRQNYAPYLAHTAAKGETSSMKHPRKISGKRQYSGQSSEVLMDILRKV